MWKVVCSRNIESTGPIRVARKSQQLGLSQKLILSFDAKCQIFSCYIFSMVVTRHAEGGSGSGSGSGEGRQGGSAPPEVIGQMSTSEFVTSPSGTYHNIVRFGPLGTRTSQGVTHPSTTPARARLTAEFLWDLLPSRL